MHKFDNHILTRKLLFYLNLTIHGLSNALFIKSLRMY